MKSPAKSEIFREILISLKSLPKSATEIPKSREISSEITKSLLKSRNICKMGGEVGVFFVFTHAHIHFLRSRVRAWRGSAAYPRRGMGPCCFPTFTLCSHVVFCTRLVQVLAVLWGSLWCMAEVITRVLIRCRLISRSFGTSFVTKLCNLIGTYISLICIYVSDHYRAP